MDGNFVGLAAVIYGVWDPDGGHVHVFPSAQTP
jgi:hypothetical protein